MTAKSDQVFEKERKYIQGLAKLGNTSFGYQVMRLIDVTNAKASGLLSHISIMFAATAVVLGLARQYDYSVEIQMFLLIELLSYIFIALITLTCLTLTSPSDFPSDEKEFEREAVFLSRSRRRRYKIALFGTIVITVVFVLALIVEIGLDFIR